MNRRTEALRATAFLAFLAAAHTVGIRLMAHYRVMEQFLSAGADKSLWGILGAGAFFGVRLVLLLCGPGLLLRTIYLWTRYWIARRQPSTDPPLTEHVRQG